MPKKPGKISTRIEYPIETTLIHRFTVYGDPNTARCAIAGCGTVWEAWTAGSMGVQEHWDEDQMHRLAYPVCPKCTASITGQALNPPF